MNYNDFKIELNYIYRKKPILFQLDHDSTVSGAVISDSEKYYGIVFPDSYKHILSEIGGGYFGYIIIYSLDKNGMFYLKDYVLPQMIKELQMLPVIDYETGDLIGFDINDNKCTEDIVLWLHEEKKKKKLEVNFYDVLIKCGLKNEML